MYPNMVLGLSDHTPQHSTVLGAVALGASMIEKHFTDDISREGPDHAFSMDPKTWREMVDRTRELELALGSEIKKVEDNEKESVLIQRRSIRLKNNVSAKTLIKFTDLIMLRPCPNDVINPSEIKKIINKRLIIDKEKGDYLKWSDLI